MKSRRRKLPDRRPRTAWLGAVAALGLAGCNLFAGIGEPKLDPCFDGCDAGGAGGASGGGGSGAVGGAPVTSSTVAQTIASSSVAQTVASSSTGPVGPVCGDGHVDPGEACDDGNTSDGDGCSHDCHLECAGEGAFEDPVAHHCYVAAAEHPGARWDEAGAKCAALGMHLAAITSQAELDLVSGHVSAPSWIGGSATPAGFAWSDGEPWSFAPWKGGAPPMFDPGKSCVILDDGAFGVDDGHGKHGYLCEQ